MKDAPGSIKRIPLKNYGELLLDTDSRWFMFFYFITFGGFVGLASALPLYFTSHFHMTAGGGGPDGVADRVFRLDLPSGGRRHRRPRRRHQVADRDVLRRRGLLFRHFAIAGRRRPRRDRRMGFVELSAEGWLAVALFSLGTLCLGMGNGAVFQLLPQRFRGEVGVMTGLVGFAGGLGGFFLAKAMAMSKGMTGGFMAGFLFFGVLALLGVAGLTLVKHRWRTTWGAVSGARI